MDKDKAGGEDTAVREMGFVWYICARCAFVYF